MTTDDFILVGAKSDLRSVLKGISQEVSLDKVALYERVKFPDLTIDDETELEMIAESIAKAVRPTARLTKRGEALKTILYGGRADPSLRNALGHVSKALKPMFPFEASPINQLATRKKDYDDDGRYRGTVYLPTKLGIRVRELLEADNAL